ncbi:MAG: hypothetical protein HFJ95_00670 [Muribaculaceae bacterium]|nr:hypothetical protein [Muribaculaceae bacterium]
METENPTINKFSWRRVYDFGMLYSSGMKSQALIFAIIIFLSYLCVLPIRDFHNEVNITFFSLMSVLVAYCIYSGPIILARRDDSLMVQVPAKTSEKTIFYFLYSLVIVPLYVEIIWLGINIVGGLFIENGNIDFSLKRIVMKESGVEFTLSLFITTFINTVFQIFAVTMTVLLIVIKAKKHRFIKGLLTPVFILLIIGILGGIFGVIAAIYNLNIPAFEFFDGKSMFRHELVDTITSISLLLDVTLFIYCGALGYYIYNYNKKQQIA